VLEDGELPFAKTGTHRRLRLQDVLSFKKACEARRKERLDGLARLSEQVGGGYPELD
jgi:hypothetical protein